MRFIAFFSLFFIVLFAKEVKITAQKFEADEKKMVSIFSGNVHLQRDLDEINASILTITFDKEGKPISYEASGDLHFAISADDQFFIGSADYMIYKPKDKEYKIVGNAFIHEINTNKKLYGEKIIIDRKSGKSKILGTSTKPVKFIFSIQE